MLPRGLPPLSRMWPAPTTHRIPPAPLHLYLVVVLFFGYQHRIEERLLVRVLPFVILKLGGRGGYEQFFMVLELLKGHCVLALLKGQNTDSSSLTQGRG